MLATNRWRNWNPSEEKFDTRTEAEPTKPTKATSVSFVSSISGNIPNFSDRPTDDPEAWREDALRFIAAKCSYHPRWFGGVKVMHRVFCDWQIARNEVPCSLDTFTRLLGNLGLFVGEIDGVTLVSGLALEEDVEAFQ